jgi:hypothetical protein
LKVNRVEATSLCVTVQCDDEQDPAMLALAKVISDQFMAVWQTPPEFYQSPRRRDRPDAYLFFRTSPDKADSKSLDSGGLLAVLHAISLFSHLHK